MLNLKTYRSRAKGLPDLLPYGALITPDTVLCKDGSLLAAWEIRGMDTESSTDADLEGISMKASQAFKMLGGGWMLQVDAIRMPAASYPSPEERYFTSRIARLIDDTRRQTFQQGFFSTTTVLSVTWKPSAVDAKLKKLTGMQQSANLLEQSLESFKKTLSLFEDALSSISSSNGGITMDRLRSEVITEHGQQVTLSPLLSFIQTCLTGDEFLPVVPHTPMYLDAILGGQHLVGGLEPRIGKKHIAVIALDGLPSESWPSMLSLLASLPFASRFFTRYICMDHFDAMKEVERYRKTWAQNIYRFFDKIFNKVNPQPNEDAQTMSKDAKTAYAELEGGYIGAGFYTANMVLLNEQPAELEEHSRLTRRAIMHAGFGCRHEEINALEAWLSTHPGNSFANVRRPMISTLNLADFLPLSSVWTGSRYNPCDMYPVGSPALLQCSTDSTTPFWFNLHVDDLGHTLILGPTGSGKSTLLALIAAQFTGYSNARIFAFDKGMSMYVLCRAVMGAHYAIGGIDSPALAPLRHLETPEDLAWAEEWLSACMTVSTNKPVLPAHQQAIRDGLAQLQHNSPSMRTLSAFVQQVQNAEVKQALRHYTKSGGMGHVLDAKQDALDDNPFLVFEIDELMKMGERNLLPVLLYLFRRIERSLAGQPTMLILDEAWIVLGNLVFREKLRDWLKTLRKANCAVVLATQSLSDVMNSGIVDVILESCPTKVLLANDKADTSTFLPLYDGMGLNERQIDIIKQARPKREYYIQQGTAGCRLVNLALSPLELAFVGSSSKDHIARVKDLESNYGPEAWQDVWIKER